MGELVSLAGELEKKQAISSEELLASALICCGTLAATVGPAAVQILPVSPSLMQLLNSTCYL